MQPNPAGLNPYEGFHHLSLLPLQEILENIAALEGAKKKSQGLLKKQVFLSAEIHVQPLSSGTAPLCSLVGCHET
eukprot:77567-Amphidinium_carterae.1